jgi:glutathione S-transferase
MPHYTAFVTMLVVLFYFFIATRVPVARRKFKVRLPAVTGDPGFERVFRVHQNTLEWLPLFLPPLWLCALYLSDLAAAGLGLLWIVGRYLYYVGYAQQVEKRLPGFFIQATACLALVVCALVGMAMRAVG